MTLGYDGRTTLDMDTPEQAKARLVAQAFGGCFVVTDTRLWDSEYSLRAWNSANASLDRSEARLARKKSDRRR